MSARSVPRWQSLAETLALVVLAVSVAWMAVLKPALASVRSRPAAKVEAVPLPVEPISLDGAPTIGAATATTAMIIYSDFQCPFCARFAVETLPILQEQYVKTGRLLIAFREFPLPIHPFAQKAAEAALCAHRQRKFWEFHDALFANPAALDVASLGARAQQLGLETATFTSCLGGETAALVASEKRNGESLGVGGTPGFLLGSLLPDGRVKVLQRASGAKPLVEFQTMLDALIGAPIAVRPAAIRNAG
jgi:protein-disulfide isomerase